MNITLIHNLQDGIDICNQLLNELDDEKGIINECLSGVLMKEYLKCSDETIEKTRNIKTVLFDLQCEEKIKL